MSNATGHAHGHVQLDDGRVHAHISSGIFLVGIFSMLIILTVLTVAASYVNFGSANAVIAVLIATVKASLVALFFMHLRHDRPFNGFIFVMGFVFLGIFLLLTMDDLATRGRIDDSAGVRVLPRSGDVAPGGIDPSQAFAAHEPEHQAPTGGPTLRRAGHANPGAGGTGTQH